MPLRYAPMAQPLTPTPRAHRRAARRAPLPGLLGAGILGMMLLACMGALPWTLARVPSPDDPAGTPIPRYIAGSTRAARLPPAWAPHSGEQLARLADSLPPPVAERIAREHAATVRDTLAARSGPAWASIAPHLPPRWLGTDALGRDLLTRSLVGGAISLTVGIAAALVSVCVGTIYGSIAAFLGGRADALLMRIVDILYGLPYILLVVLLAVAADGAMDRWSKARIRHAAEQRDAFVAAALAGFPDTHPDAPARRADAERRALDAFGTGELSPALRQGVALGTLLVAIGAVSWLTLARVVRGQVLSLKAQPFLEAARALGLPRRRQFLRHILPNLAGPIVVYATLIVPQAILQESFLSFLGIGVRPPLPSWGNLAADGLAELNRHGSNWWLLVFPCLFLGLTLLALNLLGEWLRDRLDPKRRAAVP